MSRPHRLPSGKYRIQWYAADGFRRSAVFTSKNAAEAALRARRVEADEIRAGLVAPPKPEVPTLASFIDDRWWPTYPGTSGARPLTLRGHKINVTRHLKPLLGERRLDELRGEVIDQFVAALRGGDRKLKDKSILNVRSTLTVILHYAARWEVITHVPVLPRIRVKPSGWEWFNAEETKLLLEHAWSPEDRILMLFAMRTGARMGEQRAIEWGDIDWTGNLVIIRRNHPLNTKEVGPPKSGKERRVPLSAGLKKALLDHRGLRHLKGGRVFNNPKGGVLSAAQFHEPLWGACRRAGLREIRWHDLRHTFASQLATAGVALRQIQEWMGHSTITMTERYAHLAPGRGDAINVLDEEPSRCAGDGSSAAGNG